MIVITKKHQTVLSALDSVHWQSPQDILQVLCDRIDPTTSDKSEVCAFGTNFQTVLLEVNLILKDLVNSELALATLATFTTPYGLCKYIVYRLSPKGRELLLSDLPSL